MRICPLKDIEGLGGAEVRSERTETGWFFKTAKGLRGRLKNRKGVFPCRIAPGEDREVVQLGCGEAAGALCNALYDSRKDVAYVFLAQGLRMAPMLKGTRCKGYALTCEGPLSITMLHDYMRVHRGLPWYRLMNRKRFPRPPAGWCSWYYYYLKINEEEIVKNTEWLAANLKQFGCEWVQIDDGWQGRGDGFGSNRNWFVTCERDFPRGMKWCADYIRSKDLRPGIWCIPFTQSDSEMYAKTPSLFVRREDGASPGERAAPLPYDWMPADERKFEWAGRYFIDPTGEEGRKYLKKLFRMICDEWGYDYVKIDAQAMMPGFFDEHRERLQDPSLGGDRTYRDGLETMRSEMGYDRFLLNCGAGWASCGLCDGIRIGGDVSLSWQGMMNAIGATMEWLYLNTLAFYTDPDVVCVREPLSLEQARLWATLVAVTGQLLMASDKMYALPQERVELLRRIFPVADIHPMELYPLDAKQKPSIFDLKLCKPAVGCWDVVALFNWDESAARTFELSPKRLGLPERGWVCLDGWTGAFLRAGDGNLKVEVPAAACRAVTYWPDEGRPMFVGSSRHITQGALDVEKVAWNQERLTLSGASQVVAGDTYTVRIYVPDGFKVVSPQVAWDGRVAKLTLKSPKNRRMKWHVEFAGA